MEESGNDKTGGARSIEVLSQSSKLCEQPDVAVQDLYKTVQSTCWCHYNGLEMISSAKTPMGLSREAVNFEIYAKV